MAQPDSKVPFLKYDYIRDQADKFRQRFACSSIICPIEEIIEQIGIDIIPTPGLRGICDTWGILSSDLSAISVDEYCWNSWEEKYRFTLAHEIGHYILHSELYQQIKFDSVATWRETIGSVLSNEEYGRLEFQADAFAGLVLVPSEYLGKEFEKHIQSIKEELPVCELSSLSAEVFDIFLQELCRRIAQAFIVAPPVIDIRLRYDSLRTKFEEIIKQSFRGRA